MRGKVGGSSSSICLSRITPAHAGKSFSYCSRNVSDWDHPRTCGEKFPSFSPAVHPDGSPPHMRGKAVPIVPATFPIGITPAHAGKSQNVLHCGALLKDHPRTCGEKRWHREFAKNQPGSPPHMRGKVGGSSSSICLSRITPAHAGKSFSYCSRNVSDWDHPRTCGEKKEKR